ncbi:MAG: hypothetical protein WAK14_09590, partial [Methanobacterium sp.]
MINVLIIIILVIIIIIASIMMIPFHITLNLGNRGMDIKGYFKITWIKIKILQREIPSEKKKKEEVEEEVRKKERAEWNLDRIIKVLNLFLESMPHLENII